MKITHFKAEDHLKSIEEVVAFLKDGAFHLKSKAGFTRHIAVAVKALERIDQQQQSNRSTTGDSK